MCLSENSRDKIVLVPKSSLSKLSFASKSREVSTAYAPSSGFL